MDKSYEAKYHTLEERHWWFASRRDMVLRLIGDISPDTAILEVGCSGGPLLLKLAEMGCTDLTGIDVSDAAIELSHKRGFENTSVMDGANLTFDDQRFDLLIASDVLEHIEDHERALAEWYRVLRPGGRAIIFVPALQWLWSKHDTINHHYRRYRSSSLSKVSEAAGFKVKRNGYWNVGLLPTVALYRKLENLLAKNQDDDNLNVVPGPLNGLFKTYMMLENAIIQRVRLPLGVSTFVVLEKKARLNNSIQ